jgi:hypothetical protein
MSMTAKAGLLNFQSKDPQEIIFEMSRLRKRILLGENIDMPQVTLLLWPEGKQVTGFILDVKSERSEHHIAIQLGSHQNTGDVFYAYLGAVRGVTVHAIEHYEHLLTEVTTETKMNRLASCTKLDVRTGLDSGSKKLSALVKSTIAFEWRGELPEGSMSLFVVNNLINDVTICLLEIAQTELGKQAITTDIGKIIFTQTKTEFTVQRQDKALLVSGAFTTSFSTSKGRSQLKERLEALL